MSEMNRKNRKASGGRATNSVLEYSTVPWNDAVEVGEVVTMDHVGTSVDLDEDGEELDYLEVAWLLRDKLDDFVEGGKGGPPGLELRSLLIIAAARKIVSIPDSKKMSPVLWKTLPKELLLLVLARLPVPDIIRLRSLSKEWNRDMASVNSEINRACDEASPAMVAGISRAEGFPNSRFIVIICDLSTHKSQYNYRLHPGNPEIRDDGWIHMGAHDGGLVCFVSAWRPTKANPLCIVVVNLLTRVRHKLPPLQYVYLSPPKMMHIEVDSETKCYRVVVVDEMKGRPTVEIYDSGARQWTKATPPLGFIFGINYRWTYCDYDRAFYSISRTPSVYDFVEGQIKRFDEKGPSPGASLITYAVQDCLFVLHRNTSHGEMLPAQGYCITKYRIQNNAKDWVEERSYLCSPFETLLEKDCCLMTLKVCEGFLMVFPHSSGNRRHFWLLDLSSGAWRSLPNCFQWGLYGALMTRLFWNVVP